MTLPAAKLDGAPNIRCWTWFHRVSFLVTGILTTIINQIIFYNGVGDPSTGFLSLPTYLGMLSVIVVPTSRTPSAVPQYRVVGSASIDVCSQVLCMLGLQVVGSGVFQVLYSAVVCFTALLSTCILGKSHSALQWVGILAIACGLGLTSKDSVPGHPEHGTTFVVGIFVTLMGCVGYACSYVCNEGILSSNGGGAIVPQRLCVLVGLYGSLLHLVYITIFIVPDWQAKVVDRVAASGSTWLYCVMLYGTLVLSSLLHNVAYFHLLCYTGAVSTGVLTALRAVGVFFVSGHLFCEIHTAQCLTASKVAAALTVASGTLIYSLGSTNPKPTPSPAPPQQQQPRQADRAAPARAPAETHVELHMPRDQAMVAVSLAAVGRSEITAGSEEASALLSSSLSSLSSRSASPAALEGGVLSRSGSEKALGMARTQRNARRSVGRGGGVCVRGLEGSSAGAATWVEGSARLLAAVVAGLKGTVGGGEGSKGLRGGGVVEAQHRKRDDGTGEYGVVDLNGAPRGGKGVGLFSDCVSPPAGPHVVERVPPGDELLLSEASKSK